MEEQLQRQLFTVSLFGHTIIVFVSRALFEEPADAGVLFSGNNE